MYVCMYVCSFFHNLELHVRVSVNALLYVSANSGRHGPDRGEVICYRRCKSRSGTVDVRIIYNKTSQTTK
jgi:hypothetical protein